MRLIVVVAALGASLFPVPAHADLLPPKGWVIAGNWPPIDWTQFTVRATTGSDPVTVGPVTCASIQAMLLVPTWPRTTPQNIQSVYFDDCKFAGLPATLSANSSAFSMNGDGTLATIGGLKITGYYTAANGEEVGPYYAEGTLKAGVAGNAWSIYADWQNPDGDNWMTFTYPLEFDLPDTKIPVNLLFTLATPAGEPVSYVPPNA